MKINDTSKYIAIKVRGLDHWLWFLRENTEIEGATFTGVKGWGEDGAFTEISLDMDLIEAQISSENLQ